MRLQNLFTKRHQNHTFTDSSDLDHSPFELNIKILKTNFYRPIDTHTNILMLLCTEMVIPMVLSELFYYI